MILTIDVTNKEFQVTRATEPKADPKGGEQRLDRQSQEPMWVTQVVVTDDDGGEIIKFTTAGVNPKLEVGDLIDVYGLIATPWTNNGRTGVAFNATRLLRAPTVD